MKLSYSLLKNIPEFQWYEKNGDSKNFFYRIPYKKGDISYIEAYIGTNFGFEENNYIKWAYYEHNEVGGEIGENFGSIHSNLDGLCPRFIEILKLANDNA